MSDERDLMVTRIAAARGALVMSYRRAVEGKVLRCICGHEEPVDVRYFDTGWPEHCGATMELADSQTPTPGDVG